MVIPVWSPITPYDQAIGQAAFRITLFAARSAGRQFGVRGLHRVHVVDLVRVAFELGRVEVGRALRVGARQKIPLLQEVHDGGA